MPTAFNLAAHHDFVMRHGQQLRHYVGLLCPCGNTPDANRARINCFFCGGLGIRYQDPLPMVALITSVNREKALLAAGIAQPGDLVLSPSPYEQQTISDWNAIEIAVDDGQPFNGELIKRGVNSPSDVLAYKVKQILDCHSVNQRTQTITNYTEGTDFTIDGRTITWLTGQPQPPAESIYSIKYTAILQWVVFVGPQSRQDSDQNIGLKAILRLRHIVLNRQ